MNDTIIIYREPAKQYRDGYKPECWVAVELHRNPEPYGRTVHVGLADRSTAIAQLEEFALQ